MKSLVRFPFASHLGLLVFSAALGGELALAAGYFPDLNENAEFRRAVTEALYRNEAIFDFADSSGRHQYVIDYEKDYVETVEFFRNPVRERVRQLHPSVEPEDDQFQKLLKKMIYAPSQIDSEDSIRYKTFIKRPKSIPEHGVENVNPQEEIGYFEGSFLESLAANFKIVALTYGERSGDPNAMLDVANNLGNLSGFNLKKPIEHPDLQGPYFTFTLREIPKEYLTAKATLIGLRKVKEAIQNYIREAKSASASLRVLRDAYAEKLIERRDRVQHFALVYKEKVKERALAVARTAKNPESAFNMAYEVTRNELTPEEAESLDRIDHDILKIEEGYDAQYTRSVTAKLRPEFLIPYIIQTVPKSAVIETSSLALSSSDDESDELPAAYVKYALARVGQRVFDEMRVHERLQ